MGQCEEEKSQMGEPKWVKEGRDTKQMHQLKEKKKGESELYFS